jgi:hypothetical protein
MRVMCWNMRRATAHSAAWDYFRDLHPNIALLQEVWGLPEDIRAGYKACGQAARTRSGGTQGFGTYVLAQTPRLRPLRLTSGIDWVDGQLEKWSGNLTGAQIALGDNEVSVISAYSPAWPIEDTDLDNIDTSSLKLTQSKELWATELLCGSPPVSWTPRSHCGSPPVSWTPRSHCGSPPVSWTPRSHCVKPAQRLRG